MYTFLWWWLQLGDRSEAGFIFIVYLMRLPATLMEQHEMGRQLTNRTGYGRKWSWVNLRYYNNWRNPWKTCQDIPTLCQELNTGFLQYEAGMLRMWPWLFMTRFNAKIIGFNAVWGESKSIRSTYSTIIKKTYEKELKKNRTTMSKVIMGSITEGGTQKQDRKEETCKKKCSQRTHRSRKILLLSIKPKV